VRLPLLIRRRVLRPARLLLGVAGLGWAATYLAGAVRGAELARVGGALLADPAGLVTALAAYAGAFGLRTWAWCRVLPGLPAGQAWAALHVSLLGNHVLPLRLGEALRPASVARRTDVGLAAAAASTVTLRAVDLLAVLGLALLVAPALMAEVASGAALAGAALALAAGAAGGALWGRRLARSGAIPVSATGDSSGRNRPQPRSRSSAAGEAA